MKNGYRIIDAHAHVFPDKIAEKASDGISNFYHLHVEYHGKVSEMLQNGTAAGIDRFLICSPATVVSQVHAINTFQASCEAAYPMCIAFGTLHPKSPTIETDLEELVRFGLHGIKLHPDFQQYAIDEPAAYPMYDMIQSTGLPILLHMGDKRTDFSHPGRLAVLLRKFPKLRIIAAHLGGWDCWREASEILHPDDRLRFDTSSSTAFLSPDAAKQLIDGYGAENCFFGVDYPMWEYEGELARFFALGLTEHENRLILSENFESWMHLVSN